MQHWARTLADTWGIEAELSPLPGEFDLNFLATARDGQRVVLKVMRPG
jgi:Ser/Thr protein kinase RdoA (MazF antagonist)